MGWGEMGRRVGGVRGGVRRRGGGEREGVGVGEGEGQGKLYLDVDDVAATTTLSSTTTYYYTYLDVDDVATADLLLLDRVVDRRVELELLRAW